MFATLATKPEFLVAKEKMLVALATVSVATSEGIILKAHQLIMPINRMYPVWASSSERLLLLLVFDADCTTFKSFRVHLLHYCIYQISRHI